jgi:outer membrane protein TolC
MGRKKQLNYVEDERALGDLNRLLGLPPRGNLVLQGDDLTYRGLRLNPGVLENVMVARRPDLQAAREEYEQAQQQLRLAHIQRIPWFRFGPSYEHDGGEEGTVNKLGLGVAFEIPLANLNRGELQRLEAARERLHEGFAAKVHAARGEVADALRTLRVQERLVGLFENEIRPALDENAQLTDASLELGEVNVLQFVAAQSRVLKSRREFIEARLDYWKAVFDLERALGVRVSEVEGREE